MRCAARNLVTFLREQEAATGVVPSDRTIVVERFRDEMRRLARLHPLATAAACMRRGRWLARASARLARSRRPVVWSDDGIALHFPDADVPPPLADLALDPGEVEDSCSSSSRSRAVRRRFRENAARALLIPRRRPGSARRSGSSA